MLTWIHLHMCSVYVKMRWTENSVDFFSSSRLDCDGRIFPIKEVVNKLVGWHGKWSQNDQWWCQGVFVWNLFVLTFVAWWFLSR